MSYIPGEETQPALKARDNPFRVDRILEVRYRLRETTWDELLARLEGLDYRAAIVGPDGSGKTTLMEDLAGRLRERGARVIHLFMNLSDIERSRRIVTDLLRRVEEGDIVLFDGADHLSPMVWWWLERKMRKRGGLVITAHGDGLLPTLIECRTDTALLDALLDELVAEDADALRGTAHDLFNKMNGNVRDVLRALYDLYAAREAIP